MKRNIKREMWLKIKQEDGKLITLSGLTASYFELKVSEIIIGENTHNKWRELLVGAHKKHLVIWGEGVFKNRVSDIVFRDLFFADRAINLSISISNFSEVNGAFLLANIRYSSMSDKELRYKFELHSAGEVNFTNV